ncbi:MAG: hypothetical protein HY343_13275 [Lentisphaerae bacterium]|nr:hypothetical protein [Lentisphaerota bacterium]
MDDKWKRFGKRIEPKSGWRKLKAHVVRSDGTHEEIKGEGIYIELDHERGILIALHERSQNEGISLVSAPQADIDQNSFKPGKGGMMFSAPVRSSHLVLSSGGANVFYVSAIAETGRACMAPIKLAGGNT